MDLPAIMSGVLLGAALLVGVPILILFVEVLAGAFLPRRPDESRSRVRGRIAILVPAHNESAGLLPTLTDIKSQLLPGDRLLVVADNCSDDTAEVAALAGAEVAIRNDATRRGKSYALDFGIEHLAQNPPDVLIIVDADCRVHRGTIAVLADACARTQRPAQALYLMQPPLIPASRQLIAAFAWRVKNWVRPLGLHALKLPCQLMGTGMAFPWKVVPTSVPDDLVEDVRLGLDLATAGYPPVFCPDALVTSEFPSSVAATDSQRRRWEHGHLQTIVRIIPKMLGRALARRNLGVLVLSLDMLVPPVSLLALAAAALWAVTAFAAVIGLSSWPLMLSTINTAFFFTAILLAWLDFGRDILPTNALSTTATYALAKFSLYRDFFRGRAIKQWVRTDRDVDPGK